MKAILVITLVYLLIYVGIDIVQNGYLLDKIVFGTFIMALAIQTLKQKK